MPIRPFAPSQLLLTSLLRMQLAFPAHLSFPSFFLSDSSSSLSLTLLETIFRYSQTSAPILMLFPFATREPRFHAFWPRTESPSPCFMDAFSSASSPRSHLKTSWLVLRRRLNIPVLRFLGFGLCLSWLFLIRALSIHHSSRPGFDLPRLISMPGEKQVLKTPAWQKKKEGKKKAK